MLKEQILDAGLIEIAKVKVEGLELYVRQLSYGQRLELEKVVIASKGDGNDLRQQAILHCTCDENGDPVFSKEDLPQLMALRHTLVDAIFVEIDKINGLTAKN